VLTEKQREQKRVALAWRVLANYCNANLHDEAASRIGRSLLVALDMLPETLGAKEVSELRRIQPDIKALLCGGVNASRLDERVRAKKKIVSRLPHPSIPRVSGRGIDSLENHIKALRAAKNALRKANRIALDEIEKRYDKRPATREELIYREFQSLSDVIAAFILDNEPSPIRVCKLPNCGRLFVSYFRGSRGKFCSDPCRYGAKARSREEMRRYQYQREARILLRNEGAGALEEKIAAVERKKISAQRKLWQTKILRSVLREKSR
jgi:hypothetical protein